MALGPTTPRERLLSLDVLRGFALLGVLLANLDDLYSLRFTRGPAPADGTLDAAAQWFMRLAVHGRAQTLLTLLFGFGFATQLLRAQARGERALPMYLRRLVALLAIGWCHVLLLSWVDVTWGYAVVGFFLLPFAGASNRARLVCAALFTVVPAAIYAIPEVAPALQGVLFDRPRSAYIHDYAVAVHGGDRLAIMHGHVMLALVWTFGGGVAWYLPWLLGRFLLGFVAGARRLFDEDGAAHLRLFRLLLVGGLAVAVPALVLQVLQQLRVFDLTLPLAMLLAVVGALGLLAHVAAYVGAVVLLLQRPRWRRILGVVAPVGRMPLTTYLMQSLICTTLFYGWGLDWGTPGSAACIGLGLAIFAVQVALAHAWLRAFRFGPAEWLWRSIVYWRRQPMLA